MTFAPWFGAAVAVGAFIIGVRAVGAWARSRRNAKELRRREASRELYARQMAGGHSRG